MVQVGKRLAGRLKMSLWDCELGAEGSFGNGCGIGPGDMRWSIVVGCRQVRCVATGNDEVHTDGVCRSKHGADVLRASDIGQHNG